MVNGFIIDDLRNNSGIQDELFRMLNLEFPTSMLRQRGFGTILRYIDGFRPDLLVIAEDRYIDKVYRNSFSNYFSTKLNTYPEYCVRLSFLEPNVKLDDKSDVLDKYLGFMILRPIMPGVVGRTAVHPNVYVNGNDLLICKSKIRTSILGFKTFIEAFPHSSQDSEYSTCAETSIWSILEYFGNKYPEYTPILPSQIHEILDKKAHERHVPSHGLTYFDISYVLKSRGFGCMNYCRYRDSKNVTKDEQNYREFRRVYSTYIESGIPLGVAIMSESSNPFGHAVVCVGRARIDRSMISSAPINTVNGKTFRRWSDVPEDFIFNDDNVGAYQLTKFYDPAPQHRRDDLYISNIIVPLYNKIYLDARRATYLSEDFCTRNFDLVNNVVFRTYLASGNTYMDYLMTDSILSDKYKRAILQLIKLPKFIWVTEITEEAKFEKGQVEGILLLDATEPYKLGIVYPLFGAYNQQNYFYDFKSKQCLKDSLPMEFECLSFSNFK